MLGNTRRRRLLRTTCGFSLLEALIAITIVATAVAALAQLFTIAMQANRHANVATLAVVLAQQKMEQLRGLAWTVDALGAAVSDITTNTAVSPETPSGGVGLRPSPAGALADNVAGYCDFIDPAGRVLGGGGAPVAGTVFVRRWSIDRLPQDPDHTLVLQVAVTSRSRATAVRSPDDVRIVSVRTRKAS